MDYAFSLVKLETMSVEEFLKMDGDDGWLIGKNLIVCSECRANVFLKRGEIRTPHFAHAKFRENNDGCSKRVRDYNPDRVRKLRAKQSKYRVGYFQQRFEDYLFISLLDTIKKSNLFYVNWDADSKDPSTPIIGLQKVDDSMYPEKIKHLRDIGSAITSFLLKKNKKNKGARDLGEAAQYWLDLNKSTFSKFGPEKYKKDISKNIKYEGTNFSDNGLKTDYVEEISSLKFTFRDGDEIFAAEAMTHLLQKGAEPLVGAAMAAAMELNLSTKLSQVWRDQGLGVFEEKKYGMGLDFFVDYLNDVKQSPAEHFTTVKTAQVVARFLRDTIQ
ncbi:competence protein CoiA family protein [Parasynechococcus marenigrum]|nr:hypothetical protein [Parasynechococcus marenigrum]